jgi:hypothetical protein
MKSAPRISPARLKRGGRDKSAHSGSICCCLLSILSREVDLLSRLVTATKPEGRIPLRLIRFRRMIAGLGPLRFAGGREVFLPFSVGRGLAQNCRRKPLTATDICIYNIRSGRTHEYE